MPEHRASRLLRLITLLQSERARTVDALCGELRVSRRSLFRDIKTLQDAGIPCYCEKGGKGYRIARAFSLTPVSLTVPETLGLLLIAKSAAAQGRQPLMDAAVSAVSKLVTTVPDSIRAACADIMERVSVDPGAVPESSVELEHYATLQRCIDEGRVCQMLYQSPAEKKRMDCELRPYALHAVPRGWYVLGWTDLHREVRMFKLSRIVALAPQAKMFVKPRNFKVSDKLGQAWKLVPEGRIYEIKLEFSSRVGSTVSEVRWHPTQKHELLADGRCRMTFTVDGLGEISWWICGYADQVKIIAPPELRKRVRAMLSAAVKVHGGKA